MEKTAASTRGRTSLSSGLSSDNHHVSRWRRAPGQELAQLTARDIFVAFLRTTDMLKIKSPGRLKLNSFFSWAWIPQYIPLWLGPPLLPTAMKPTARLGSPLATVLQVSSLVDAVAVASDPCAAITGLPLDFVVSSRTSNSFHIAPKPVVRSRYQSLQEWRVLLQTPSNLSVCSAPISPASNLQ